MRGRYKKGKQDGAFSFGLHFYLTSRIFSFVHPPLSLDRQWTRLGTGIIRRRRNSSVPPPTSTPFANPVRFFFIVVCLVEISSISVFNSPFFEALPIDFFLRP